MSDSQCRKFVVALESEPPFEPVGFDFSVLLSVLLPVLLEMVTNCIQKRGAAAVESDIRSPDLWVHVQIDRALRSAAKDTGCKLTRPQIELLRWRILTEATRNESELLSEIQESSWNLL